MTRHVKRGVAALLALAALPALYLVYAFAQQQAVRQRRVGGAGGKTVTLRAGDDLQRALDAAQPGDEVVLQAGATYTGNFVLPVKSGEDYITVRSSRCVELAAGERVSLQSAPFMARLATPNVSPAVRAPARSHHWRLQCLEVTQGPSVGEAGYSLIQLGEGAPYENQKTPESVPHHFELDRVLVRTRDAAAEAQNGVVLNAAHVTVRNSHVSDIKRKGIETHALVGWNGPGPFQIENNFLEAASIPILFGGATPTVKNLVPSDILIRGNTLFIRPEWKGRGYAVKNLLELKSARRAQITGNVLENSYADGQTGWAVIFNTFRDGGWEVVEDVTFSQNVIRNTANGINLNGIDPDEKVNVRLRRVRVSDNLLEGLGAYEGEGKAFQMVGGSEGVTFDHNTVKGRVRMALLLTALPNAKHAGLAFTNNLMPHGEYGVFGDGGTFGAAALDRFADRWTFAGNALYDKPDYVTQPYPPGNSFPRGEAEAARLKGADGATVGRRR
ncbi:MAG TPA: hypothetical protein VN282_09360 [Pyrinomonadaceae bacterium]|nr:hypothetical protein [Pyrinomonadaceae bacterium]